MTMPSVEVTPGVWLEEYDDGHFMMVERNGKASVIIHRAAPAKTPSPPTKVGTVPFQVRTPASGGQEIVDAEGRVVARTTDGATGELISKLLNLYTKAKERKK